MHIAVRLADAVIADVWARYDLGQIVHRLRHDPTRYSSRTVRSLAHMLRVHPSGLRKYSRVVELIGPAELTQLLELRDQRGRPLTWSHVEKLAEAPNAAVRKRWALEVAQGDLSVRDLSARLRGQARRRKTDV
jgi:hypothetical protein